MKTKTKKIILKLTLSLVFGLCVGYGFGKLTKNKSINTTDIELVKDQSYEKEN